MTEASATSTAVYRLCPVVYVPPRHASTHPIHCAASSLAVAVASHALFGAQMSSSTTSSRQQPFVSSGARSAFTAIRPRAAGYLLPHQHTPSQSQWAAATAINQRPPPPLSMPKLASIQQSYTKLFARNELLKLLVSKQLKQLYTQNAARVAAFQRNNCRTVAPLAEPCVSAAADISHMHSCPSVSGGSGDTGTAHAPHQHHSQRLLELSTVIKTINARAAEPASLSPPSSSSSSWPQTTSHGKVAHRSQQLPRNDAWGVLMRPTSSAAGSQVLFKCDWSDCNRTFGTTEQWSIHVTHTHVIADADDGMYYCQWLDCPRAPNGFNARYKMLIHVRSHTNDKPYRCPHCAKSFLRSETLRIHKRIHSSEKLFGCKFVGCTKRYTDPSSLRKHVKTKNHIVIEV